MSIQTLHPLSHSIDELDSTSRYSLTATRAIVLLTVIYAVLSCWSLSQQNVSNPDEPRLAVGAKQMLLTHEWLVPQFNTQHHLTKPILFYWLIAATGRLGEQIGLTQVEAFRLGPIFMGFMAMLAVFLIGRRLRNVRCGFLAAGITITSFTFHGLSRLLVVDMTLTGFLFWAWFIFLVALERLQNGTRSRAVLLAFYATLGLACMTKGPGAVAVFVIVPVCAFLFWDGKAALLKKAGLWWGAPLAILIGHWWFIALYFRGLDMWRYFFIENFGRIGGLDHLRPIPFFFYLEALLGAFAPWIVLLPFAIRAAVLRWRERRSRPFPSELKLLCCCIALPFTFLGLAVTKRPIYMLPLYPFLSLFVACYLDESFLNRCQPVVKPWMKALRFACPLLLSAVMAAAVHFMRNKFQFDISVSPAAVAFVLLAVTLSLAIPWSIEKGQNFRALALSVLISATLLLFYEDVVVPALERRADSSHFFADVSARVGSRTLIVYGENLNEAVWYLDSDQSKKEVKHLRKDPRNPVLQLADAVILMPEDTLNKTPELKAAVEVESTLNRGGELFTLATARELKSMSLDGEAPANSSEQ
jgi:4-amino-4-deoxy-L-arabinose transferase-like glycosyltransferase